MLRDTALKIQTPGFLGKSSSFSLLKLNIAQKTLSTKAELYNLHDEKMFLSETGS